MLMLAWLRRVALAAITLLVTETVTGALTSSHLGQGVGLDGKGAYVVQDEGAYVKQCQDHNFTYVRATYVGGFGNGQCHPPQLLLVVAPQSMVPPPPLLPLTMTPARLRPPVVTMKVPAPPNPTHPAPHLTPRLYRHTLNTPTYRTGGFNLSQTLHLKSGLVNLTTSATLC